jgi:hypothetical protein
MFLPLQNGSYELRRRIVKKSGSFQIVSVISYFKPCDSVKFLWHLCLSLGTFMTELHMFIVGSVKMALVTAGLLVCRDGVERQDIINILQRYVLDDLAFHPLTARQLDKCLLAAAHTLEQALLPDTVCQYVPYVTDIMLKDLVSQQVIL